MSEQKKIVKHKDWCNLNFPAAECICDCGAKDIMKKLPNVDVCIYHGNCADGFCAAISVRLVYPDAVYHAGFYGEPYPDIEGKDVVLVDFSYKRPVLLEMATKAKSILILDHHKSAMEDLVELPDNVTAIFDMERSGARMAWDFFHPEEKVPMIVQHVEDRDLWRFNLEGTREISSALFSYEYDLDTWSAFFEFDLSEMLMVEGRTLNRKMIKDINEMISRDLHYIKLDGHIIPALNTSYFYSSEAGSKMAQGNPFSACYSMDDKNVNFSLRSTDAGVDVSKIAFKFGGGGHRNASGFSISRFGPSWDVINNSAKKRKEDFNV